MIDLHSHILPSIDDGATSLADSLAMAEQSVASGVTHMVCTPHIHQGYFENTKESISRAFESLVGHLRAAKCPLKLAYAAEVRICPEVLTWIQQGSLPFLGQWQGKKALLLELPHSHIPPGVENLLRWLNCHDIQPIIPHPERNREIVADFPRIKHLKRAGCLFQVTAGSFVGRFSEAVKQTALSMLEQDMIHYIASDTHSVARRPNDMGLCHEAISPLVGEHRTKELLHAVPLSISQNLRWH